MPLTYTYRLSFDGETASASGDANDEESIPAVPMHQCAESKIYSCDFFGVPAVCKHRFPKAYRHSSLDTKLREQRTVREARALVRCHKAGIRVPVVYGVHKKSCKIFMERIAGGSTVKDALDAEHAKLRESAEEKNKEERLSDPPTPTVGRLLRGIGEVVGLMHNLDVIHGDLTTSNFLTTGEDAAGAGAPTAFRDARHPAEEGDRNGLVAIDFGLVSNKNSPEERAVDLYVLERGITSAHPFVEAFAARLVLEGYQRTVDPDKGRTTLARLALVRARGRKRSMVG